MLQLAQHVPEQDPVVGPQGAGRAPGGKGEPKGGGLEVGVEHRGPAVVLWLWEAISGGGEVVLRPQPIRVTAGPEGPPFSMALSEEALKTNFNNHFYAVLWRRGRAAPAAHPRHRRARRSAL